MNLLKLPACTVRYLAAALATVALGLAAAGPVAARPACAPVDGFASSPVTPAAGAILAPVAIADERALADMIGPMIIVGFVGTAPQDPGVAALRAQIACGAVGGVMLLARNVSSPAQVRELNRSLSEASTSGVPLITVDQEGGAVQRLNWLNGHDTYPSARQVGSSPASLPQVYGLYSRMAAELARGGFNVNFGPVVDLAIEPDNPIINRLGRSYGTDPARVVELARVFALAHRNAGILTAAKHFPGHGSSRLDSHLGFTDVATSWQEVELRPFRDLAADEAIDMIMVSHLHHPRFSDGELLPASLSRKAITAIREDAGFDGVIVSDDMEMGAVVQGYSFEERIVRAVAAGVDLLIFANLREPVTDLGLRVRAVILAAVKDGRIPAARITDAHDRITRMKQRLTGPRDGRR